jgi:protein O-GlcNAc transferase
MDIFGGWQSVSALPRIDVTPQTEAGLPNAGAAAPVAAAAGASADAVAPLSAARYTLFVTRELSEHANMFHASTDWLNAFFMLHTAGVVDGLSGSREGMEGVQVVLLDEQKGPFEASFWQRVFSPAFPVLRVSDLRRRGIGRSLIRRALFVPPGYTNFMLSQVGGEADCHGRTHLLQSYRAFVLRGLGLGGLVDARAALPPLATAAPAAGGQGKRPLRVTFVSRRPYSAAGVEHPFMGRQLENEEELLAGLQAPEAGDVEVQRVDLALLSVQEQLDVIARTDVLVGARSALSCVRGALLLLPPALRGVVGRMRPLGAPHCCYCMLAPRVLPPPLGCPPLCICLCLCLSAGRHARRSPHVRGPASAARRGAGAVA